VAPSLSSMFPPGRRFLDMLSEPEAFKDDFTTFVVAKRPLSRDSVMEFGPWKLQVPDASVKCDGLILRNFHVVGEHLRADLTLVRISVDLLAAKRKAPGKLVRSL